MIWCWSLKKKRADLDPLAELEAKLGYRFKDRRWLEMALIHPSHRYDGKAPGLVDNQRLEFVGDAALGLTVAEELFRRHPLWDEGRLTQERSRLTKSAKLVAVARRNDLGRWLKLGRGEESTGGRDRDSNLEDLVESLLGAAYLDGGIVAVSTIFQRLWGPESGEKEAEVGENPKGELQEVTQKRWRQQPRYAIIGMEGPPHAREFIVQVSVQGQILGEGRGRSRRAGEQAAARNALERVFADGAAGTAR